MTSSRCTDADVGIAVGVAEGDHVGPDGSVVGNGVAVKAGNDVGIVGGKGLAAIVDEGVARNVCPWAPDSITDIVNDIAAIKQMEAERTIRLSIRKLLAVSYDGRDSTADATTTHANGGCPYARRIVSA